MRLLPYAILMYQKTSKRISFRLKLIILNILKYYKNFNPEKQILIFSDPRGGSTWLAEMINTIPKTAVIWEPLNIREVKIVKKLGFGWRQYIPENQSWPEADLVVRKLFAGKVVNEWIMLNTSVKDYFTAKQLIIKICRGNMLLPWITNQINFRLSPIYMIRHPFAVVSSQMKQGGWNSPFKKFEVPDIPYNEIYIKHQDYMASLSTKEEILTAYWCLTNLVALSHHNNNKRWITLYYENLLLDPEKEIRRIFKRWEIQFPYNIRNKYRKMSRTTLSDNRIENPKVQLARWRKEFNRSQLKKMSKILEYFDIRHYSAKDEMPKVNFP